MTAHRATPVPRPRRPGRRRPAATVAGLVLAAALAVAGCADPRDGGRTAPTAPTQTASPPTTEASTSTSRARPASRVRSGFVAFGDFGGGEAQQAVADAMERWAARHRVDALVTTGDNVYERGEPERFAAQLDRPYRDLRRTRPMWVSLGNHDVSAGHGATQLRHLGLPDHPYAKTLPGVQLLFLDSNRIDGAQAEWLERQLAGPGPPLRVVVFHHPAWSCSRHDSTEEVTRRWGPVLERHRVALVLNGHDHNYQRFVSAAGVTYVVTGGGGKPLYPLDEDCPAGTPRQAAEARRHHFTAVEVRDGSLVLTAVAADDTVLDRTVIRR
jgi:3',5'-cyclic AMP phosphodiesterase CpdA